MSDYFFYDMNKKMADLAKKQQLAEDAQATPAKPAPNKLMEAAADYSAKKAAAGKDIGKPGKNFSKIAAGAAKRYGSAEAGKRVAGAVLNKLRHPTEESVDQAQLKPWKATMKEDGVDESAFQAAIGKKKYGDQGMKALQKAGRNGASEKTKQNIRNRFDKYDESMTDEGNAFSGAVAKAKRDGIQPDEKISVGGKQYPVREADATPQHVDDWTPPAKPAPKASAPKPPVPVKPAPKKPAMYPPQAIDDPVKEAAKWRDPKHKDKLYTQEPGDNDDDDYMDLHWNDYGAKTRPVNDPGVKRRMGGVGDEFARTDPLTKGFRMSADKSINTHGKRKGLPSRDQVRSLKGSIKDVLGKHTEPNLPEGGVPMTPKQKKFAALAKPFDKITFADKIVGAKKEVDEMLGDVAASAMKKAVRGRNRDMEESFMDDDEPTSRKSSTGGRIDTSQPGRTIHRAVKGNYSGAGHDAGADDDEPTGAVGRRRVGAGMGKKIGAKINRGTSKLMTKEGDMPEDMIEPQDQGEYDQEGEMAKDSIKTVVRHAQALEKILGDNDNLPEWVQSKLAKIESMMSAVDDYMQNQEDDEMETESKKQHFDKGYYDSIDAAKKDNSKSITKARKQPFEEESTNTRDDRAEKAGRRVAKDIEYDEKKKDGIHGKRRGSEDSKAERAGKKVTKDIEYDEKKKDKKKKEVDETTSSGSVATSSAAPKSSGGTNFGKGIYDSLNRQLENMISESMNINMSMNNDEHGGPRKSLTVTATDDDAVMLAGLLKMAGMGHGDEHIHAMTGDDSDMDALHNIDHMHSDEPCEECGQATCECDSMGMMDETHGHDHGDVCPACGEDPCCCESIEEAYGDTDASENEPDWPTDEEGTDDAMMYSGGLNGPKSTGQTTVPVIAHQNDRMGSDGDHELRRMMEIAGLR
jgi:hypothetical protein